MSAFGMDTPHHLAAAVLAAVAFVQVRRRIARSGRADPVGYPRSVSGHSLLAYARRAAGLTQDALARLAGTSQPTLSAYERGTKSPSLAVAERIIDATGHRLEVVPNLEFVEVPGQHGLHPFWLANQLWRLDPERAFSTVLLPGPDHHWPVPRRPYYLRERTDRARAYELILREGSPTRPARLHRRRAARRHLEGARPARPDPPRLAAAHPQDPADAPPAAASDRLRK